MRTFEALATDAVMVRVKVLTTYHGERIRLRVLGATILRIIEPNRDVDKRYVFEAGADAFLVKPFSVRLLLSAVDDVLRGSKL